MNAREIELVRSSFAEVAPVAEALAANLYQRLFRRAPELRPLFSANLARQQRKLTDTLAAVVETLDRPAVLTPMVEQLGVRHIGYGTKPEHYAIVGDALIESLRDALGPRFGPDADKAWRTAYTLLADTMIAAANRRIAERAASAKA